MVVRLILSWSFALTLAGCASTDPARTTEAPRTGGQSSRATAHTAPATTAAASSARATPTSASAGVRATLVVPPRSPRPLPVVEAPVSDRTPKRTCDELGNASAAQVALAGGHYYLDPDGDGVACEPVEGATVPSAAPTYDQPGR